MSTVSERRRGITREAEGERERARVSVRVCDRHRLLSVWLQLYSATTRQQQQQLQQLKQQQVGTLDFCAFPADVSARVAAGGEPRHQQTGDSTGSTRSCRLCRLVRSLPVSIFSFFFLRFLLNYFFNCRSVVVIFITGDWLSASAPPSRICRRAHVQVEILCTVSWVARHTSWVCCQISRSQSSGDNFRRALIRTVTGCGKWFYSFPTRLKNL